MIGGKEHLVLLGGQVVVDAEVAEVEEGVAHARVFPIDDPDPRSVIDEVAIEQIVVAGAQPHGVRLEDELDPAADRGGGFVFDRDRHPASDCKGAVGVDGPEGNEPARDGGPVVDQPQRIGDPLQGRRAMDSLVDSAVPTMNRVTR